MNILLTNDDGIHSDGLHLLAEALKKIADVIIIAPETQRSAVGVSLSIHKPLRLIQLKKNIYISDGTPADCVALGLYKLFQTKKLDLVVSGINAGANLAEDVFYSGTVGAVIEARMHNLNGIAVSMQPANNSKKRFRFDIAAKYAVNVIKKYFCSSNKGRDEKIKTFNLNIPAVQSLKQIKGLKFTKLDSRKYPEQVIERKDSGGHSYYWLGGAPPIWQNSPDSDYNAISNKYASITPLVLDITDQNYLKKCQRK